MMRFDSETLDPCLFAAEPDCLASRRLALCERLSGAGKLPDDSQIRSRLIDLNREGRSLPLPSARIAQEEEFGQTVGEARLFGALQR
jgi:hypothetical protein